MRSICVLVEPCEIWGCNEACLEILRWLSAAGRFVSHDAEALILH